jgi:hypothetical protein
LQAMTTQGGSTIMSGFIKQPDIYKCIQKEINDH